MTVPFACLAFTALACLVASCASQPPPMPGSGDCTYTHFDTTCDLVEQGRLPGDAIMWADYRARELDARATLEVDRGTADASAVEAALRGPLHCHGQRIVSGTCAPYAITLDPPALPEGARVRR